MKSHKENIEEYLRLGGSSKTAKQLTIETLQNKSRLSYLISQLKPSEHTQESKPAAALEPITPEPEESKPIIVSERKGVFTDLICQYPVQLHSVYKKRFESWLEACSLKLKLNDIDPNNISEALDLQIKIIDSFDDFDKCQNALDRFNENNTIITVESGKDFSKLSPAEIILKRNNIRTNITKRKKTIQKKKDSLPTADSLDYIYKLNILNQKIEELQDLENQESELNKLIK